MPFFLSPPATSGRGKKRKIMSSLMGPHGVALATAMAVSGTVVLLAVCRQWPFPARQCNLRSCISSEERKRERASSKKKKKVRFAAQVVELLGETSGSSDEEAEEELATLPPELVRSEEEVRRGRGMPANRVALYNGILQDRLHRMACSY
ncbi:uncharacterized protein [Elaeis guineensis]|uniref:Uncharacterized protein LOC105033974 n=1 Tax=Elaeis guineensis var. tenera TaxID=51953 RepID=A0A6I9QED4_ELAGV|nr:uncharacterized protein LOC105033974 [Elaeis guineensis]